MPKISIVIAAFPVSWNAVADAVWLGSSCFARMFCSAVLILLNMSILPLTVSLVSHVSMVPGMDVTRSAVVTMSVHKSAASAAAARPLPPETSLNDALPPWQMRQP